MGAGRVQGSEMTLCLCPSGTDCLLCRVPAAPLPITKTFPCREAGKQPRTVRAANPCPGGGELPVAQSLRTPPLDTALLQSPGLFQRFFLLQPTFSEPRGSVPSEHRGVRGCPGWVSLQGGWWLSSGTYFMQMRRGAQPFPGGIAAFSQRMAHLNLH